MAGTNGIQTPRRIVTAVLIAMLVGSVITVSAGMDSYDELGPAPERFGTAAPEPGQRTVYHFFEVERGEVTTPLLPYMALEWLHPFTILDAQGSPLLVDGLMEMDAQWRLDRQDEVFRWGWSEVSRQILVDVQTETPVAVRLLLGNLFEGLDNGGPVVGGIEALQIRSDLDGEWEIMAYLHSLLAEGEESITLQDLPFSCMAHHSLQGVSEGRRMGGSIVLFPAGCMLYSPNLPGGQVELPGSSQWTERESQRFRVGAADTFEAIGTQIVENRSTVVFRGEPDALGGRSMLVWLSMDEPNPVQIAWQKPGAPDSYQVVRMVESAMAAPIADSENVVPAPQIQWTERPPWGIDMTGVEYSFTAQEAWEGALGSGLGQFLLSHPDAVLVEVHGSQFGFEFLTQQPDHWWTFTLVAPDIAVQYYVEWRDCVRVAPLPSGAYPCVFGLDPRVPRHVDVTEIILDEVPEVAMEPPERVPTGASLMAALDAYLQASNDEPAVPNSWCYGLTPSFDSWGFGGPSMCVGFFGTEVEPFVEPSPAQAGLDASVRYGSLSIDHEGYVTAFVRLDAQGRTTIFANTSESVPGQSDGSIVPAPSWNLPALAILVGGGLLGLLLAALYYLSPLAKSGVLGLFSRVTPDAALDHPARRRLYAAIEESPGIHLQELVRVTGSGRSTIEHHLDKLVDTGLVQRRVAAGYACYFPARTDRRIMAAAPALRSATARRILAVAMDRPGATAQQLAESVGVGRSTVHHHLQRLAEAGVLRQDRDGASLHWYPTDAAAKVAAR